MPAIEISILRSKINLLAKLMGTPAQTSVQELSNFYESYSDLTFQSGLFSVKAGDLPAYRTPVLLNREVETAFIKLTNQDPHKSLEIIDLLASKPQLEPRQLASSMLGALPSDFFEQVSQRLSDWALSSEISEDIVWIFKRGSNSIRQESPEIWLGLLQSWLESGDRKVPPDCRFGSHLNDQRCQPHQLAPDF